MNRRALKYPVVAALFSAAFLFGTSPVNAYTYNGVISSLDNITEDKDDLIVMDNSKIFISTNNFTPQKRNEIQTKQISDELQIRYGVQPGTEITSDPPIMITGIPSKMTNLMFNQFKNIFSSTDISHHNSNDLIAGIKKFNTDYGSSISTKFDESYWYGDYLLSPQVNNILNYKNNEIQEKTGIQRVGGGMASFAIEKNNKKTYYLDTTLIIDNASITVSNNSTLTLKGNVQTSKAINVTGISKLNTDTGTITGGTITSDGDIIAQSNYSAPSGKSTIAGTTITSTGALTASKDIKATTGSITGSVIQSTSGNVVANNTIKATGKVKGDALNVGVINASSAAITGNQSISGIFTTTGQAKLNGGAALGGKKITGLGTGTISGTSTEAVNGAQLYTINQKLASAGKSYTAGSDIAISSANAISVSKTGAVKSGDTGIVTGGTVYAETNSLNTKLNGLKDLVNSHQATISSLQQQMGDLNQTISDINSNVASATSNLSNQLKNCLKSDMGNLSAAGRTAIKNIVSDSLKSMGRQNNQSLVSPIATFEASDDKDTINTKDIESVHSALANKVDKSALSEITTTVDINTKQISSNADNIHSNVSSIESLKSAKADVFGSNIDTTAYASKLGTGSVDGDNTGLVTGAAVYSAISEKADIGYVDAGIDMMENQMEGIKQQATHDMNRVGAGASALAGLHPSTYDASDKLSFASGYGHYKNANTSALGAFYHPNEKTMVSVAGTIGNNDAMLSAGVSIKLGMSAHVSKVMVTPKMFSAQEVANQDMRDQLDTQSERIHQIELALQNR